MLTRGFTRPPLGFVGFNAFGHLGHVRLEGGLGHDDVAVVQQVKRVEAVDLGDADVFEVLRRRGFVAGDVGQSDQTRAVDLESRQQRGELLGAGLVVSGDVDEANLAVDGLGEQGVAVGQPLHLDGHVLPPAVSDLGVGRAAAAKDVGFLVAATGVAGALLLVQLAGRAFDHAAVFGRGVDRAAVGVVPHEGLLEQGRTDRSAEQTLVDLDGAGFGTRLVIDVDIDHGSYLRAAGGRRDLAGGCVRFAGRLSPGEGRAGSDSVRCRVVAPG